MMNLTMKMVELKEITDNYKVDEDIIVETGNDIENVLVFNRNGEFKFVHFILAWNSQVETTGFALLTR